MDKQESHPWGPDLDRRHCSLFSTSTSCCEQQARERFVIFVLENLGISSPVSCFCPTVSVLTHLSDELQS
ncbi:hypothetical protein LX36DRAFT_47545 [Colletotrichum falcatum]|nr:hypothetical protein LX36DRAFT_47545 [Colletotrichum falcatum]